MRIPASRTVKVIRLIKPPPPYEVLSVTSAAEMVNLLLKKQNWKESMRHREFLSFLCISRSQGKVLLLSRHAVGLGPGPLGETKLSFSARTMLSILFKLDELAIEAPEVILIHNHILADAPPNKFDIDATLVLLDCFREGGIPLLDHLVLTPKGKVVSLRNHAALRRHFPAFSYKELDGYSFVPLLYTTRDIEPKVDLQLSKRVPLDSLGALEGYLRKQKKGLYVAAFDDERYLMTVGRFAESHTSQFEREQLSRTAFENHLSIQFLVIDNHAVSSPLLANSSMLPSILKTFQTFQRPLKDYLVLSSAKSERFYSFKNLGRI